MLLSLTAILLMAPAPGRPSMDVTCQITLQQGDKLETVGQPTIRALLPNPAKITMTYTGKHGTKRLILGELTPKRVDGALQISADATLTVAEKAVSTQHVDGVALGTPIDLKLAFADGVYRLHCETKLAP